jgi:hypothetical protein
MKTKFTMLLTALLITSLTFAQGFKGNASGTFGIFNRKVRIQYEMPLSTRASFGVNLNYYLRGWSGPVLEPFIRVYGRKRGNAEGLFGQAKFIYGNLLTVDDGLQKIAPENKRWTTYGAGISIGYKFLVGKNFTIEPLTGYRFLTPPYFVNNSQKEFSGWFLPIWYLTTGQMIDFQIKFGYQF